MKVIFAGTPLFSVPALQALLNAGHEIALVLTQPDRPAGRGMKTTASPVKLLAEQYGLAILQPDSLKRPEAHEKLASVRADVMIVVAYGLILPSTVLNLPKFGCINIHASLLPRWRGAAPIERAILAGDGETGISIMQMDPGLDTGPIMLQHPVPISDHDTARTLREKLAGLGAACLLKVLASIQEGTFSATHQNDLTATYAPKIDKREAQIEWQSSAEQISRVVRAFNPVPGAYTRLGDLSMKIWQVSVETDVGGEPGTIVAIEPRGIVVACGQGGIVLETVQKAGGKVLSAEQFLLGHSLLCGKRFAYRND